MLAVMNLHRLRVDVRLERGGVVRQRRKLMGHGTTPRTGGKLRSRLYSSTFYPSATSRPASSPARERRSGCERRRRRAPRAPTADGSATRGTSSSTGSRARRASTTVRAGATSRASRLTRWISVPTAQTEPSGLALTVRMMCSVDPQSSAACTTSNVHSGMHDDLARRMRRRGTARSAPRVKRVCTLQWPFHRISRARRDGLGVEAAERQIGIPHHHLVERHAHADTPCCGRGAGRAASAASRPGPTPTP